MTRLSIILTLTSIVHFDVAHARPQRPQSESFDLFKASKRFDPEAVDTNLLEKAIIYYTNLERKYHDLQPCRSNARLRLAARRHSDEMAAFQTLFHESPNKENKHLADRLRKAGLNLANTFIGENLGVDYLLAIADVPYHVQSSRGRPAYINAETGRPIPYQTYRSFARRMVENWMKSPGHRKNIMKKDFNQIGIGIAVNTFNGIRAFYVTQNFMGPIRATATIGR